LEEMLEIIPQTKIKKIAKKTKKEEEPEPSKKGKKGASKEVSKKESSAVAPGEKPSKDDAPEPQTRKLTAKE
jgi:hypothetical protein